MLIDCKHILLLGLVMILFGGGCCFTHDQSDYQIFGGNGYHVGPNGSTLAILDDRQYYVTSDLEYATNRKDGYSSRPLTVTLTVKNRLMLNTNGTSTTESSKLEIAGSLDTKEVAITFSPDKDGISVLLKPAMSFSRHDSVQPNYAASHCVNLEKVTWQDIPIDGWLYGIMYLYYNNGPDIIDANGKAVRVVYVIPKYKLGVKVRKWVGENDTEKLQSLENGMGGLVKNRDLEALGNYETASPAL